MMAKITKGCSFAGCVSYVLREDKSRLLKTEGVEGNTGQITEMLEWQSLLNERVKNKVGHISLNFRADDSRMHTDDGLMVKIAEDYMERMGIQSTQYLIARHTDREHPHCHIVFNRVNNNGKTISDKNERYRNERVCKMLTAKYRLHFSDGKENVKVERLRPYDRAKYEIGRALNKELPHSESWNELKDALLKHNVGIRFKVSRNIREIQGVKFSYGGIHISGSKVQRDFSYLSIDRYLQENKDAHRSVALYMATQADSARQSTNQVEERVSPSKETENYSSGLGLLNASSTYDASQMEEIAFENTLKRKKKSRRKRGFRL